MLNKCEFYPSRVWLCASQLGSSLIAWVDETLNLTHHEIWCIVSKFILLLRLLQTTSESPSSTWVTPGDAQGCEILLSKSINFCRTGCKVNRLKQNGGRQLPRRAKGLLLATLYSTGLLILTWWSYRKSWNTGRRSMHSIANWSSQKTTNLGFSSG